MQDIFHQKLFSEIRKEDGKLRTHSLFKDTIGTRWVFYSSHAARENVSAAARIIFK